MKKLCLIALGLSLANPALGRDLGEPASLERKFEIEFQANNVLYLKSDSSILFGQIVGAQIRGSEHLYISLMNSEGTNLMSATVPQGSVAAVLQMRKYLEQAQAVNARVTGELAITSVLDPSREGGNFLSTLMINPDPRFKKIQSSSKPRKARVGIKAQGAS